MTGELAYKIWEQAVEPARILCAKVRAGEPGAAQRLAGMMDILSPVGTALVREVTVEEGGKLGEILSEFAGLLNLAHWSQAPTCPKCRVKMGRGMAIVETVVMHEDFGGDAGAPGATRSHGGPGNTIGCWKCPQCGHSEL